MSLCRISKYNGCVLNTFPITKPRLKYLSAICFHPIFHSYGFKVWFPYFLWSTIHHEMRIMKLQPCWCLLSQFLFSQGRHKEIWKHPHLPFHPFSPYYSILHTGIWYGCHDNTALSGPIITVEMLESWQDCGWKIQLFRPWAQMEVKYNENAKKVDIWL